MADEVRALDKHACPACGAQAEWNPAKQLLVCPFCGTERRGYGVPEPLPPVMVATETAEGEPIRSPAAARTRTARARAAMEPDDTLVPDSIE